MKTRALAAALVPLILALSSCSGDDGKGGDGEPGDVLAEAKSQLDSTTGVHLLLHTDELAKGVSGVTKADGVANHQPAFEGKIDVFAAGSTFTIPVISVDGEVYAVLPFTKDYAEIRPSDYGAPDPAALMDPASGISGWLTKATGVKKGDQTREGDEVLTTYDGTLPGTAVVSAIPSADDAGSFDASFSIDEDGRLRSASLTGVFYKGKPEMTYVIDFDDYGTEKTVKAPAQ